MLGAGTMGAQIAAHLANAGLTVTLLDVSTDAAKQGLAQLRTLKPDPCFVPDVLSQIAPGNFDDDARRLTGADWIIEAVVELVARVGKAAMTGYLSEPANSSAAARNSMRIVRRTVFIWVSVIAIMTLFGLAL